MNQLSDIVPALWQSSLSILKILLQSKWGAKVPRIDRAAADEIVILGNGPSLNDTIAEHGDWLAGRPLLAVNFAACAPQFMQLRPRYYVLADPHFFAATDQPNVAKLWRTLAHKVSWPLTLMVPARFGKAARAMEGLRANPHLTIATYNTTPIEGFARLENWAYAAGLGMPRPRNVLIPSLMNALAMGYRTIYLAGADHSWTRTLSVDDNNNVVSIQPHFYKEDEREVRRVNTEYMHYPLHQIMYSFYVAFRSYFTIERYARHRGAGIINITPGSFIDAFPRKKL